MVAGMQSRLGKRQGTVLSRELATVKTGVHSTMSSMGTTQRTPVMQQG